MMQWYGDAGWAGWVAMGLMMAAFWGLLLLAVVAVVRSARLDHDQQPEADPQRVLDERLARGDIDEDDYTRRRELLRSGH